MLDAHHFSRVCYQDRGERMLVRGKFGRINCGLRRILLSVAVAIYMAEFVLAAPRPHALDDRAVAKVVEEFFVSQPDYQRDDLITRSQIEKVVAKLVSDGVKISDPGSIAKRGLADDSFLVRELSTPSGKRFMRKISTRSGGYSHLDRLSTSPRGESIVRDLMRTKDGDKMIEYLATTKGGKNMGSMMAQARGGVDLNKPTGRIYTADDLMAALNDAMAKP
jgi:hypothetical protein